MRFQASTSHVKEHEWSVTGNKQVGKKKNRNCLGEDKRLTGCKPGGIVLILLTASLMEPIWQAESMYREGVERQQSVSSAHRWATSFAIPPINTPEQIKGIRFCVFAKLISVVFKLSPSKRKASLSKVGTVPSPQGFQTPSGLAFFCFGPKTCIWGLMNVWEACFAPWVSAAMRGEIRGVAQGSGDRLRQLPPPSLSSFIFHHFSPQLDSGGGGVIAPKHCKIEVQLAPPCGSFRFFSTVDLWIIWPWPLIITLTPNPANLNTLNTIPGQTHYKATTEIMLTSFFVAWHPFSSGAVHHLHKLQLHIFVFCAGFILIVLLSSCTLLWDHFN